MSKAYWIEADMDGERRWHFAMERGDEVYFPDMDFAEAMTIHEYRKAYPENPAIEIPSPGHDALLKIAAAYDRYLTREEPDRFDKENFLADVGDALGRPL